MRIVFVGTSGFPDAKTATISRLRAVVTELVASGSTVQVVNNLPGPDQQLSDGLEVRSVPAYRGNSLVRRARAIAWEIGQLGRLTRAAAALHVYTQSFPWTIAYLLAGWWFRTPVVLHYVEMRSRIEGPKSLWKDWNDRLLDGRILRCFDAAIAISTRLREHVREVAPGLPCLLLPPVCDFDGFADVPTVHRPRPYFVYCGSIAYRDVIEFVMDSWIRTRAKDVADLVLVIGGPVESVETLRAQSPAHVQILRGLEYTELLGLYKGAAGLLIPLRPTEQDLARFPQKCCEYLACGGPMLSTELGEIGLHFADGHNALLAPSYTAQAFAELVDRVIDAPAESRRIARSGTARGRDVFHVGNHRQALHDFFQARRTNPPTNKESFR